MPYRGLIDRKGELFAYLDNGVLYTIDGDATGRLEGDLIVDMAGNPVWRVQGDGVYSLDATEAIGYFSARTPEDY